MKSNRIYGEEAEFVKLPVGAFFTKADEARADVFIKTDGEKLNAINSRDGKLVCFGELDAVIPCGYHFCPGEIF